MKKKESEKESEKEVMKKSSFEELEDTIKNMCDTHTEQFNLLQAMRRQAINDVVFTVAEIDKIKDKFEEELERRDQSYRTPNMDKFFNRIMDEAIKILKERTF